MVMVRSISSYVEKCKAFDVFTKPLDDFQEKTLYGGLVTIIYWLAIVFVICSECYNFIQVSWTEEIFVDLSMSSKLQMHLDMVVPKISCSYLSIDAADTTGDQHLRIEYNIYKRRVSEDGEPIEEPKKDVLLPSTNRTVVKPFSSEDEDKNSTACGSCYGAKDGCCNTCTEVREAYRLKGWQFSAEKFTQCLKEGYVSVNKTDIFNEGCQIFGSIEVNRVGGSFHIAPGHSFSVNYLHIHDVHPYASNQFNTTHYIRHLSFGRIVTAIPSDRIFIAPLDGHIGLAEEGGMMFHYFIKLVPTMIQRANGLVLHTNQFSVTKFSKTALLKGDSNMPGIFFSYELAPLMVKRTEEEKSIGHLITTILSNVSGIYIAALLVDSFLHRTVKYLQKLEIGKQN